jgi:UDP-GlcNAc:undecaprenyl-phosphate/decaprenyl-phosphate GlcNAc-1-phosphate transferase
MALPETLTAFTEWVDPLLLSTVLLFVLAAVICLLLTRLTILWSRFFGIMDEPDWRKVHKKPVSRAGGLAFYPAFLAGLALVIYCWPELWRDRYTGLAAAALLIVLTGLLDDIFGMKAIIKLSCQFIAGATLYFSGYQLHMVSLPFTESVFNPGVGDFLLTVVLVAAIINAVNMLDGLDGLAAGSAFIMCAFFCFTKISQGAAGAVAPPVIIMGIALAFLRFNFYPARVFMGDTGSMFLGLMLASEVLDAASRGAALTTILLPMAILGVPVFDMLRTILTRARAARNIFAADKNHLHHQLLKLGFSHAGVVLFIYVLNIYMGIMAIIYGHVAAAYRSLYLVNMGLFLFIAFYLIAIRDRNAGKHDAERDT